MNGKSQLTLVKIGGNVISDENKLNDFLNDFAKIKGRKVLVHGGGKLATEMAEKLGIASKMVDGRRITDKASLDIITMVYGGLINKKIVAHLQKNGCNALGLSGADINCIEATKRPIKAVDYGYVGDIEQLNHDAFGFLLEKGITPVLCPITHDGGGQLLNTNADTIAAEVAISLSKLYKTTLFYCFEKNGVLKDINDKESLISHIDKKSYKALIEKGIIKDGMLPKLHNCFHALEKGVSKVCLGNEKMIVNTVENHTFLTL